MSTWMCLEEGLQKKIQGYVDSWLEVFSGQISSVMLYGDVLSLGYQKDLPLKLLLVMEDVNVAVLDRALPLIAKGVKQGFVAPLILTESHIRSSADVFPIEFWDFKERHIVIWGDSIWSTVTISADHLRLECEQQLKGKLIRLRQSYLEVGGKPELLRTLIKDSFLSFWPLFRSLIRLKSVDELLAESFWQKPCAEHVAAIEEAYAVSLAPFKHVLATWEGGASLTKQELPTLFGEYLQAIEQLAASVDAC